MTYGEFAALAGKPKAARAAGSACASNPIPIIYPCHRVVRADGSLGNYGGGSNHHPTHPDNLARKGDLLKLEANLARAQPKPSYSYDQRIHRYSLNSLAYQQGIPSRQPGPSASRCDEAPTFSQAFPYRQAALLCVFPTW